MDNKKEKVTKEIYNVIFSAIKEPLITTIEYNSLTLPEEYTKKDLILNVKKVLVERGLIGTELKKLALYAAAEDIDIKKEVCKPIPNSNILIGGSL